MNLDIGCGSYKGHKPLKDMSYLHGDIHKTEWNKSILNIICDVQHLPFKAKVFHIVYASHVLEHLSNPIMAIKEMLRVCKDRLTIKIPHVLSKVAKQNTNLPFDRHLNVFRRKWFGKVLKNYRYICKVNYQPFLMFFNRPYEIEVTILKES